MRGTGYQNFVDQLTRFAAVAADRRVRAIAERAAAPLRVAVRGRRGVGCATVARALRCAGGATGIAVLPREPAGDPSDPGAELVVYVIAEVVKPEDRDATQAHAAARQPVVAVLNKADLAGPLSGSGPISAARTRCARYSALLGVPVEPMIGLLAAAVLDDLDEDVWVALRLLAADPASSTALEGSFDGFLAAQLPIPTELRRRLLRMLDLFGIAIGMAAFRALPDHDGPAGPAIPVRALLRRVSGIDAVVARICAMGAEVRYRRVLAAVAELEALAVSAEQFSEQIGRFLGDDDTVLARMAAAAAAAPSSAPRGKPDLAPESDPSDGPVAYLGRAVHWQRCTLGRSRDNRWSGPGVASDIRESCRADIVRGALRLWSRAGGTPQVASGEPGE